MKYGKNKARLATVFFITLSLCSLLLSSLFSPVQATPWTRYTGEAVSLDGEPLVVDAWAIKDGATYKMWYTHSRADMGLSQLADTMTSLLPADIIQQLIALDLQGLLEDLAAIGEDPGSMDDMWGAMLATSTVIGYAESADGIDWDVVDDEVLAGNTDEGNNISEPCVIKEGGIYKMWFTHTDTSLDKATLAAYLADLNETDTGVVRDAFIALLESSNTCIGYAESADGIDWGTPQFNVFGAGGSSLCESIAEPCVINDGGTYRMWYTYAHTELTSEDIYDILDDMENFGTEGLLNILNNANTAIGYAESADETSWAAGAPALYGDNGIWDSVASPCVIYNGSGYEMWYTGYTTDFTQASFSQFIDEMQLLEPDITALWNSLASGDIELFIEDLIAFLDGDPEAEPPIEPLITPLLPYLSDSATCIGYAVSADASSWAIDDPAALTGGGSPWGSVAAPCVVFDGGSYEMWFTQGLDELSAQNVISLMDGTILPIGYATFGEEIELVEGWNFIGLPLSPSPADTDAVLSGILENVQTVWAYDASTGTWSYFTTIQGAPQGALTEMNQGTGYWIEISNPCTLIISGAEASLPYTINLVTGWNLVSIPETPDSPAIGDVLTDILDNVQTVWNYNAPTGTWNYFTTIQGAPQGALTEMTEGKAYWIEMTAPDTLIID